MRKEIQAKHITTEQFLDAIRADKKHGWVDIPMYTHSTCQSIARRLDMPIKVVRAKVAKLDKQGIIEGCSCGCGSPMWIVGEE